LIFFFYAPSQPSDADIVTSEALLAAKKPAPVTESFEKLPRYRQLSAQEKAIKETLS
jgi:hypothetical protein